MSKPQPIGLSRKRAEKNTVEQVSFRMPALKKRQFAALLAARGLDMKEVLIEFIDRFIEYRGNIGVVSLDDPDHSSPGASVSSRRTKAIE